MTQATFELSENSDSPQSSAAAVGSPITQRLRQATAEAHYRLEHRMACGRFFDTRDRYTVLLRRFHGFYAALEPKLNQHSNDLLPIGIDLSKRRHAPLLVNDLMALGWPRESIAALPLCVDLPATGSVPEALGSMYVIEGSTLGGKVISRMIAERLGIGVEPDGRGGSFFASYGHQTGSMWRQFGEALAKYSGNEPANDQQIIGNACETFVKIERWLLDAAH